MQIFKNGKKKFRQLFLRNNFADSFSISHRDKNSAENFLVEFFFHNFVYFPSLLATQVPKNVAMKEELLCNWTSSSFSPTSTILWSLSKLQECPKEDHNRFLKFFLPPPTSFFFFFFFWGGGGGRGGGLVS